MSDADTLMVLGASYDSVADAEADYESVKELDHAAGVGHDFDAAALKRDEQGKVKVVKKHGAGLARAQRLFVGVRAVAAEELHEDAEEKAVEAAVLMEAAEELATEAVVEEAVAEELADDAVVDAETAVALADAAEEDEEA